jgi:hypothetical protein
MEVIIHRFLYFALDAGERSCTYCVGFFVTEKRQGDRVDVRSLEVVEKKEISACNRTPVSFVVQLAV